jgi:drug/metabolite transporter (DMT)-like permease
MPPQPRACQIRARPLNEPIHKGRQRLTGIALMCGAVACFACLDATAKFLNHHMDTLQVVWARYTGAFVLALLFTGPAAWRAIHVTSRPGLQLGRSTLLLASTVLNFLALRYLQLDQALAILFSTPFFVTALSGPMLGERVRWRRWTAVAVGFLGVLLVTRPGFGGIHPAAFLVVGGALCYAFYNVFTRQLAHTDSNETTLFYSNLVGAIAMLPTLPFVWTTPADLMIVLLMTATGAFAAFGHYLLIAAHRLAPASVLAPFIYTQLVWVIALGHFIFGERPDSWTLAGTGIVVASGLYIFNRERTMMRIR